MSPGSLSVGALAAVALSLPAAGCLPTLAIDWAPLDHVARSTAFPDAPAVILSRTDRFLTWRAGSFVLQQVQRHDLIEVRTEAGVALADVLIPAWKRARLVALKARTRTPEGRVVDVDTAHLPPTAGMRPAGEGSEGPRFRVPDVRPGSLIEYAYTVESPELRLSNHQIIARPLPIVRYQADVLTDEHVEIAVKAANAAARFETQKDADGLVRRRLVVENVAALQHEPWQPNPAEREPRWLWQLVAVDAHGRRYEYGANIAQATREIARTLYLEPARSGWRLEARPPACAASDTACLVRWALGEVRERVRRSGEGSFATIRPLRDVLAAGRATAMEEALLVQQLLSVVSVPAQLALYTRNVDGALDADVPTATWFDAMLVYLPPSAGSRASSGLFVDPSCDRCVVGQVRPGARGATALVLSVDEDPLASAFHAAWVRVDAEVASATRCGRTYDAWLDASGDLRVEADDVIEGEEGARQSAVTAGHTAADEERDARKWVEARAANARLDRHEPFACDAARGTCRRHLAFTIPGYATTAGERLLVPLTVWRSEWDAHAARALPRHQDYAVRDPTRVEETVALHLPPGWSLEDATATQHTTSPVLDVDVTTAAETTAEGTTVRASRVGQRHVGRFPASDAPTVARALSAFAGARERVLAFRRTPTGTGTEPASSAAR